MNFKLYPIIGLVWKLGAEKLQSAVVICFKTMSNLIDFGRYPIDKRDSDEYHQLVREARNHLLKYAIFRISNFITAEGIKSMQDQCIDIVNSNDIRKSQRGTLLNCYGTKVTDRAEFY